MTGAELDALLAQAILNAQQHLAIADDDGWIEDDLTRILADQTLRLASALTELRAENVRMRALLESESLQKAIAVAMAATWKTEDYAELRRLVPALAEPEAAASVKDEPEEGGPHE